VQRIEAFDARQSQRFDIETSRPPEWIQTIALRSELRRIDARGANRYIALHRQAQLPPRDRSEGKSP
jgi:hypothetical protein